jgi:hypothetical protein
MVVSTLTPSISQGARAREKEEKDRDWARLQRHKTRWTYRVLIVEEVTRLRDACTSLRACHAGRRLLLTREMPSFCMRK